MEANRSHAPGAQGGAGPAAPPPISASVASGGECRRTRARAHHARVPKPFVNALAIQAQRPSARFFVARLELFLEHGELREWRIRVGFAAVPVTPAALDVFRAQRRIAIRTVVGPCSAAAIAPRRPLHIALPATLSFRPRRTTLGPVLLSVTLRPASAVELGIAEPLGRRRRRPVLRAHT